MSRSRYFHKRTISAVIASLTEQQDLATISATHYKVNFLSQMRIFLTSDSVLSCSTCTTCAYWCFNQLGYLICQRYEQYEHFQNIVGYTAAG